jgi:hypothetical protein
MVLAASHPIHVERRRKWWWWWWWWELEGVTPRD